MRLILFVVSMFFASPTSFAQGFVNFGNTPSTLVSAANLVPILAQQGSYFFGLLTAPPGTIDPKQFQFTGVYGTNFFGAFPGGRFFGGNGTVVPGWPANTVMSFMVAGWSSSLGHDWNQQWLNGGYDPTAEFGLSTIGTAPAGASPASALSIFGVGGLQSGWVLWGPSPTSPPILDISSAVALSPNPVTAGNNLTVTYTVLNLGNGGAAQSKTRIQVKLGSSTTTSTELYHTMPALAAGNSVTENVTVPIPSSVAAGAYTVYVILDYNNAIGQTDTNNDIAQTPNGALIIQGASLPNITVPPLSQSVQSGANVTLTVTASSSSPLSYQWRFSSIDCFGRQSNWQDIPGETGATLTKSFVGPADAGSYSVVVRNASGSVISASATLTVSKPIILTTTPTSPTVAMTTPALLFSPSLKMFVNGSFTSGVTLSPDKISVVLTHGWIPAVGPFGLTAGIGGWPTDVAKQLVSQGFGSKLNILTWDWGDAAKSFLCDPGAAAQQTQVQGPALGRALAGALSGSGGAFPPLIHFVGHSLGTLVNASAANYLHGHGFDPANTHMTLFDDAEIAADADCLKVFALALLEDPSTRYPFPPLPAQFAWADNYISLVGQLHPGAVNVIVTNGVPVSAPNLAGLILDAASFHGYSASWYSGSIATPTASSMGFRWSFEEGGVSGGPRAGTVYVQAFTTSELDLVQETYAEGTTLVNARFQNYHTTVDTLSATAVGTGLSLGAVDGQVIYASASQLNLAINLITSSSAGPLTERRPLGGGLGGAVTNVPAYAWIPLTIPSRAQALSFDLLLTGDPGSDYFAVALNGTNVFSIAATLIQTNTTTSSGLIDVSQYAGQGVQIFLGIVGGSSTNAGILVTDFTFYAPVPPMLQAQSSGSSLVLTWPISTDNSYSLETTVDLSNPAGWSPVPDVPAIVEFQNTSTNVISGSNRLYRLRK